MREKKAFDVATHETSVDKGNGAAITLHAEVLSERIADSEIL